MAADRCKISLLVDVVVPDLTLYIAKNSTTDLHKCTISGNSFSIDATGVMGYNGSGYGLVRDGSKLFAGGTGPRLQEFDEATLTAGFVAALNFGTVVNSCSPNGVLCVDGNVLRMQSKINGATITSGSFLTGPTFFEPMYILGANPHNTHVGAESNIFASYYEEGTTKRCCIVDSDTYENQGSGNGYDKVLHLEITDTRLVEETVQCSMLADNNRLVHFDTTTNTLSFHQLSPVSIDVKSSVTLVGAPSCLPTFGNFKIHGDDLYYGASTNTIVRINDVWNAGPTDFDILVDVDNAFTASDSFFVY